jgi:hypothetical protein
MSNKNELSGMLTSVLPQEGAGKPALIRRSRIEEAKQHYRNLFNAIHSKKVNELEEAKEGYRKLFNNLNDASHGN